MKITVLASKSGEIESIAMLNQPPTGRFHIEIEGGAPAREIEADERVFNKEVLLGRKGAGEQKKAFDKLRKLL
jgi:hypothetical protein